MKPVPSMTLQEINTELRSGATGARREQLIEGRNKRENESVPLGGGKGTIKVKNVNPVTRRLLGWDKANGSVAFDAQGVRVVIHRSKRAVDARMFPSYTLAELEKFVRAESLPPETKAKMVAEIAARKSGASQVRVTPQIEGGRVQPKVGRL